jgi:AraC-like DNA-binding protein
MFAGTGDLRKPTQYAEARRLRRVEGTSLKTIAAQLGVSVSTVHGWTRDIELTAEQRTRNLARVGQPARILAEGRRRHARALRLKAQLEGRSRAREGDPLHLAGCMLYWAEGTKNQNRAQLVNSDVQMVRFFCRFLRTCFAVENDDLRLSLNFYTGNGVSPQEIERYWLDALDLPPSVLTKHSIDSLPTSSSGRRTNRLPYGVCKLTVRRSVRIIQHIYGAIQEYAGFDEPAWLG